MKTIKYILINPFADIVALPPDCITTNKETRREEKLLCACVVVIIEIAV